MALEASKLATSFAEGLVGSLGSAYASFVIENLLPPKMPAYFDQVFARMEKIVSSQLDAAAVRDVQERIDGIRGYITLTYKHLRADAKRSKKDLHDDLVPYETLMYSQGIYHVLDRDSGKAMAVFLIAANVHLALLQELALTDPNHADPLTSPYAAAIVDNAKVYIGHVDKCWPEMIQKRRALIEVKQEDTYPFDDFVETQRWWRYWDTYYTPPQRGKGFGGFISRVNESRDRQAANTEAENHRVAEVEAMRQEIGDPAGVAATWRKLMVLRLPQGAIEEFAKIPHG